MFARPIVKQKSGLQRDDGKCNGFKVSKRMFKVNQEIIVKQGIRNDDVLLAVRIACKSYHAKLFNTELT